MRLVPVFTATAGLLLPCSATAQQQPNGNNTSAGRPAPDPLYQNRVPCAHTAASLHLRLASEPPGLVAWEFLKESRALTEAQLRTLTLDALRTRRYYCNSAAEFLFLECYAGRNLEAATADVMQIPDWEDSIDEIGDYDSDVEYFGGKLWRRLAATDLPAALRLADGLKGSETRGQILRDGYDPEQTAAEAVRSISSDINPSQIKASVAALPSGPRRTAAEAALEERKRDKSQAPPGRNQASPVFPDDPALTKLAAMDTTFDAEYPGRSPLPLLEEVLKLSPETALEMAGRLWKGQHHMVWLNWMLFQRAAEGDPDKALDFNALPGSVAWILRPRSPVASAVWALKAGSPGVTEQLRALPAGDARNAAIEGYFGRASLDALDQHIALAKDLAVPATACTPLLVRTARAGRGAEAMALAVTLSEGGVAGEGPCEDEILKAWCLTDLKSAIRFLEPRLARDDSMESVRWHISEAFSLLPSRLILESLPPATLARLHHHEIFYEEFWLYLATEDIEAGFQFFGKIKGHEGFSLALESFASVAARYQPARAKALLAAAAREQGSEK